jgi:hemoglobin/transferrin/lactoferrin receptor protein
VVRRVSAEAVTLEAVSPAQADGGVIVTDTLSVAGDRRQRGGSDEARLLDSYRSVGSTTTLNRTHLERFRGRPMATSSRAWPVSPPAIRAWATASTSTSAVSRARPRAGDHRRWPVQHGHLPRLCRPVAAHLPRPDLISSLTITKGPSLQANASGGIGGVGRDGDVEDR